MIKFIKDKLVAWFVDAIIEELKEEGAFENGITTPSELVKSLTSDSFKFFDYNELSEQDLKAYHDSAQMVLRSPAFRNEIRALNAEFAEWAAKESRDFKGVDAMRHQISGILLLEERLDSIPDPTKNRHVSDDSDDEF